MKQFQGADPQDFELLKSIQSKRLKESKLQVGDWVKVNGIFHNVSVIHESGVLQLANRGCLNFDNAGCADFSGSSRFDLLKVSDLIDTGEVGETRGYYWLHGEVGAGRLREVKFLVKMWVLNEAV